MIAGAGPPAQRRFQGRGVRGGAAAGSRPGPLRIVATRRFQRGIGMSAAAAASVFRPSTLRWPVAVSRTLQPLSRGSPSVWSPGAVRLMLFVCCWPGSVAATLCARLLGVCSSVLAWVSCACCVVVLLHANQCARLLVRSTRYRPHRARGQWGATPKA
jgi:hypothetical protein